MISSSILTDMVAPVDKFVNCFGLLIIYFDTGFCVHIGDGTSRLVHGASVFLVLMVNPKSRQAVENLSMVEDIEDKEDSKEK